ncbi:Fanconi anemia group I protein-like isoform X2 [Haliotis rufescens]|uniref:Fanconi anemia group I protein-like isoform X2 n=1 Tax=Haliotis rufescens TaxID=6454 RepID=UPI00201EBC55|nr:Fanconi anemia group I protein-like isoform X2 [Haliotis rufescens]
MMEKKIIGFNDAGKTDQLSAALDDLQPSQLTDMLNNLILKGRGDPLAFLQAVFQGSPSTETSGVERLLLVYQHLLKILHKNEINTKMASNLVGLMMLEADSLPGTVLVELASRFVESIKEGTLQGGKALELFPKLLSVLSVQETVVHGENSMKGSEYKSHVLNKVCSCKWNPQSVLHLAAMFRDVPLTQDELKFVLEKVLRGMRDLDLQDLPALVYQLLLLAAKGHKRLVLEGITDFFIDQDNLHRSRGNQESEDLMCEYSGVETLRHTEGTSILHIVVSVKQDQELGREFVKYLKASQLSCPTRALAPFNLALALSTAQLHRFEDQIFDFLKSTILRCFKDTDRQQQSYLVREITQERLNIEHMVLETVSNSVYGWDHVIQSLVQLGFTLMDSFGPKAVFGRIEPTSPTTQLTPARQSCRLGARLLINTFKAHEVVRHEILDQIFNRVTIKATSPVSHYLELLADTVKSAPQLLLESVPKVREAFDYLSFLPPSSAEGLLKAIQPLLKLSMSLKDSLILVLRKAMFSKQLDSRKIGVMGFLMILKHFKVLGGLVASQSSQTFSLSQIQVDVHKPYNAASNEALCLEILGNLRRCCTQQADVRLQLYEGLYEVLCHNSKLQAPVLDMLLNQIKRYYESDSDMTPPLKLDPCILAQGESVYLAEPMGHLLGCIQQCVVKTREFQNQAGGEDDDEDEDCVTALTELEELLTSLTTRMIACEMEDFELDKSADFSLASSVGVKNNIYAILVLGAYEVLMEYTFTAGQFSVSSCEQVLKLYDNYHKLSDVLKEKTTAGAGKKVRPAAGKSPHSLLSLPFVVNILKALISDTSTVHGDSLAVLRGCPEFLQYITSVALQKVQQIADKGTCDGAAGIGKERLLSHCYSLARLLMTYYTENQILTEEHKKERKKNVCSQSLEGLVGIMSYVGSLGQTPLCQCLCNIEKDCEGEEVRVSNKPDKIHTHIKALQRLIANILAAEDEAQSWKELISLLTIITQLTKHLPTNSPNYEQVHSWVNKICTDQSIDDMAACKHLLGTLLSLTQQMKNLPLLLRDLAQDIHSQLGDTDQEVEVEDKTHMALVTHRTAPTVLLMVLSSTDRELDDIDWCLTWMKADILSKHRQEDDNMSQALTQRENHEKTTCIRLGHLVTGYHELVQTAVPYGACVEAILKTLTRYYTTITNYVKYYLSLYANKIGHLTARFEKLVKLVGRELTQNVYPFITYIQTCEHEHMQQAVDKVKKDKKKTGAAVQAGKNRAMKQTKTIPNLIYAIEQFERFIIQLGKKSKVNLMDYMKVSTSRDFRINVAAVQAVMEDESDEDEEEMEQEGEAGGEQEEGGQNGEASESEGSDEENHAPHNTNPADEDEAAPPTKKSKLGRAAGRGKRKTAN